MQLFEDIVHRALGSEIRRGILFSIAKKEMYLTEIAKEIGKKPQTVDFHLTLLAEIGLVESEWREGKKYYFIKNKEILRFLKEKKPIPLHHHLKPPHEMIIDEIQKLGKRMDELEKKIDRLARQRRK